MPFNLSSHLFLAFWPPPERIHQLPRVVRIPPGLTSYPSFQPLRKKLGTTNKRPLFPVLSPMDPFSLLLFFLLKAHFFYGTCPTQPPLKIPFLFVRLPRKELPPPKITPLNVGGHPPHDVGRGLGRRSLPFPTSFPSGRRRAGDAPCALALGV